MYTLYQYLSVQTSARKHHITLFAVVMMINFPLFGVLWKFQSFQLNEEFYLRLIATSFCALLASNSLWPSSYQKMLPFLWYSTLTFCLPFFFTYLTLLNFSTSWLMNCITSLFLLLLVVPIIDAIVVLFIGSTSAIFLFLSSNELALNTTNVDISIYSIIITLLAAIILAALFIKSK